jgi:FlaA1/EpsC-like NDP-sugar epimerase
MERGMILVMWCKDIMTNQKDIILDRPEHSDVINFWNLLPSISYHRILITGAGGSIGQRLSQVLQDGWIQIIRTDIDSQIGEDIVLMDVTNESQVEKVIQENKPTHIIHLAAQKDAPTWELEPDRTCLINDVWTKNIVEFATRQRIKVVFASTCKACDPTTVYGRTKKMGEDMVLKEGWVVSRFFNVFPSSANVFKQWEKIPSSLPINASNECYRYFISLDEAVGLLLFCLLQDTGIYRIDWVVQRNMFELAQLLYSNREIQNMSPRIGDRLIEPLHSAFEIDTPTSINGISQVVNS